MAEQLELLYRAMFSESFISKQDANSKISARHQQLLRRPVKDFTLTNVRQQSKLFEIKQAIEKLKGYRLECQHLTLIDEAELFTNGSHL